MLEDGLGNGVTPITTTDDDFDQQLEDVLQEAYPTLLQRVKCARFAFWHREQGRLDDLAQGAAVSFLVHFRKRRQLPENALAYLVKIAANLARRQLRDHLIERTILTQDRPDPAKTTSLLVELEEEVTSGPAHSPATQAKLELIRAAIERLPRRQRQAVRLHLESPDSTQLDLGRQIGISEDAFQKNLSRGMARIRDFLAEQSLIKGEEDE